jgi:hypothetical protein
MFLAGSPDRWSWEVDAFPPVAFCVDALVRDGLAVPPFDRHADGDRRLRAMGLDAAVWQEWLRSIIGQRRTLARVARSIANGGDREAPRSSALVAGDVLRIPGSFCGGPRELRDRLNDAWEAFAPSGEAWKRQMSEDIPHWLGPGQQRSLWKALLPFHDRLPMLSVFLVAYPVPVVMALPPTTCLIAPAKEPEAYGGQVVAAAGQLTAAV